MLLSSGSCFAFDCRHKDDDGGVESYLSIHANVREKGLGFGLKDGPAEKKIKEILCAGRRNATRAQSLNFKVTGNKRDCENAITLRRSLQTTVITLRVRRRRRDNDER